MAVLPAFAAAERLAPTPTSAATATRDVWARHYAALAVAGYVEHYNAITGPDRHDRNRDAGALVVVATTAMTAAMALAYPATAPALLWKVTPECGALNGEWETAVAELLADLGINPADIDTRLAHSDYADRVTMTTTTTVPVTAEVAK